MQFREEQTRTVKHCPVCLAPVAFVRETGEQNGYRIISDVQGETFSVDGYVVEKGTLVRYEGTEKKLHTPKGVLAIGQDAFRDNRTAREIVVTDGVLYVGENAFYGCDGVRNLTLPESVVAIGHYAFRECRRLKTLALPGGLRAAGYNLFHSCDNLTEADVPMNMEFLAGTPHSFCRSLRRVHIPHCVTDTAQWLTYADRVEQIVFGQGVYWLDNMGPPRLQEAYFTVPDGWRVRGSLFSQHEESISADDLRNPKKAALLLKKYEKEGKTIYRPRDPFTDDGYWLKLYEE